MGYRVAQLLHQLGIPTAAIDREPDPRFAGIVAEHIPVLTGDVRLREHLERAGTADARWFIACTPDDLTNIETCLSARRLNPTIRTVARIFDADLAERVGGSFGIDAAVSSSLVSASAFVGAASDERAIRAFRVGGLDYLAFRFDPERPLEIPEIERWRGGLRRRDGALPPLGTAGGGLGFVGIPGIAVALALSVALAVVAAQPTPGKSTTDLMPSAASSARGPMPERIRIAGELIAPAESVTRRARMVWATPPHSTSTPA